MVQGLSEPASAHYPNLTPLRNTFFACIFLITEAFLLLLKYARPIPMLRPLCNYSLCQKHHLNVLTHPLRKAFCGFAMVSPS